MPQTSRITYEDVARASTRRLQLRKEITTSAIHADLGGRGSKSTVAKYLETWRDRMTGNNVTENLGLAEMPSELDQLYVNLWQSALAAAQASLAEFKAEFSKDAENLRDQRDQALIAQDRWRKDAEAFESRLALAKTSIERLTKEVAALNSTLTDESRRHDCHVADLKNEHASKVAATKDQHTSRVARITQDHEWAEAQWQSERESLKKEVSAANGRYLREVDRNERVFAYLNKRLDKETELHRKDQIRYEEEVERLHNRLMDSEQRNLALEESANQTTDRA